jgi:hypothetical protein
MGCGGGGSLRWEVEVGGLLLGGGLDGLLGCGGGGDLRLEVEERLSCDRSNKTSDVTKE